MAANPTTSWATATAASTVAALLPVAASGGWAPRQRVAQHDDPGETHDSDRQDRDACDDEPAQVRQGRRDRGPQRDEGEVHHDEHPGDEGPCRPPGDGGPVPLHAGGRHSVATGHAPFG